MAAYTTGMIPGRLYIYSRLEVLEALARACSRTSGRSRGRSGGTFLRENLIGRKPHARRGIRYELDEYLAVLCLCDD